MGALIDAIRRGDRDALERIANENKPPPTELGQSAGGQAVDPLARSNAALLEQLNPSSPKYRGPGWVQGPTAPNGAVTLVRSADPGAIQAQNQFEIGQQTAQPAIPTLADLNAAVAPTQTAPPPLTLNQRLNQTGPLGSQGYATALRGAPAVGVSGVPQVNPALMPQGVTLGAGGPAAVNGATSANPEAGGPAEVDRAAIDKLLGNVSKATSGLAGIAETDAKYSAAQAQLALGTAAAQSNALSLARSGNRRDAAALGARALQTNAELGAEASRSSSLLRAEEEDAKRRLKLDAYKAAGDLGLNTAALEVDVNNLNMQAATSYLNNLFETNRLNLQLDEAEAARVTNFVQSMALVAKDYYALNLAERQSVRDDLTRRYGISEQMKAALAQLDAQPGFWEQAALGLIGGAGQAASSALATFALGPAGGAVASTK